MPAILSRPSAFSFFTVVLFVFSQVPATAATCVPATADGAGLQGCLISAAPGDTILLSPGTYTGAPGIAFLVTKPLTIKGTTGVVLSGGDSSHVVVIDTAIGGIAGPVTLENLTVANGNAVVFFVGGGILAASDQFVTLNNVTVQNNQAALGGGMWTSGSDTTVNSSTFLNNFASVEGGAIAHEALQARNLVVYDSVFTNNDASDFGGAIVTAGVGAFFGPEQTININNSTFVDNGLMGTVEGGALFISSTINSGSVSNNTFEGNHAAVGGAISITLGSITLEKNTFAKNTASIFGGGVYVEGSGLGNKPTNIMLLKNLFYRNSAGAFGGGFFAESISDDGTTGRGTSLITHKNHFTENSADIGGGALIFSSSNIFMEKDHYNFNTAASGVGGLVLANVTPNPLANVPAGSLSKVHFNHNDGGGEIADSLFAGGPFGAPFGSPEVTYSGVKVAGEDANDCLIEGDPNCP